MQNAVKARFALRHLPHVRLCTLRQVVLAQSQALTTFCIGLYSLMSCFLKKSFKAILGDLDKNLYLDAAWIVFLLPADF